MITIDVLEKKKSAKTDKNGNPWTVLVCKGKEAGTQKEYNLFDAALAAKFVVVPGSYGVKMEKNNKGYWNIVDVENAPGAAAAQAAAPATNGTQATQPAATVKVATSRADVFIGCANAVGPILQGIKDAPSDYFETVLNVLLGKAEEFIGGKTASAATKSQNVEGA